MQGLVDLDTIMIEFLDQGIETAVNSQSQFRGGFLCVKGISERLQVEGALVRPEFVMIFQAYFQISYFGMVSLQPLLHFTDFVRDGLIDRFGRGDIGLGNFSSHL